MAGARLSGAQQNPNQEGDGKLAAVDQAGPRLAASPSALPGVVKIGAWYNAGSFPLQDFTQSGTAPPQRPRRRSGLRRVRTDALARARQPEPRARFLCARRRRTKRSQRGRSLCRCRLHLPRAARLAAGRHRRIAFAYGRISPAAAANDRALAALTGGPMPIRDYEAAIELTYRWKLAESWSIQPNRNTSIPAPISPNRPIRRADRPSPMRWCWGCGRRCGFNV